MGFLEKVKLWFLATGLTNLGWLAGFLGALLLGWTFVSGVCAGMFVHLNWVVIKKLYQGINL